MGVMLVGAQLRRSLVFLVVLGSVWVTACTGDDPGNSSSPDGGTEGEGGTPPGPSGGDGGGSTPKPKPLGDVCTSAGECESGFCADGVCCNTACGGQCEACAGATKGTCTPVTGNPIAPRMPCTGAGTSCGGTCNGTSTSCTYVPAATICGASCGGTCDGSGTCSESAAGACAGGFACEAAGKCFTVCTAKAHCQPNFDCNLTNNTCVRVPESDCFDGVDNNGDGLADCQDPTCTTTDIAKCVDAVGTGAAIGTVVDSLPCPVGFGGGNQTLNQGLQPGSCSGCSCKTQCNGSASVYNTTNCSGGSVAGVNFTGTQGDTQACQDKTNVNGQSIQISFLSKQGCVGTGTNTWTAAAQPWTTTKVFCTQNKSSLTCGANKVCVPKIASGIAAKVALGGACPTGYAGGEATYYPTFSNGVCQVCSVCTAGANFNCGLIGFAFDADDACGGASQFVGGTLAQKDCNYFGTTKNIKSMKVGYFGNNDDCVKNSTISTPAAGTNGQVVCNVTP